MTSQTAPETLLESIAQGDAPVLEQLMAMNLDSLERSSLDPKTYFLARLAALVAMDAAPVSYMMNLGMALKNRMQRPVSAEELDRIVAMIDDTAAAIEKS